MEIVNVENARQILRNVSVGKEVKFFHFVNAYECSIDDGTKIGSFVEIQKGVKIGKNCKIASHAFVCEGVLIEDHVFIGHHVSFINDRYPRAVNPDGSLKQTKDWKVTSTSVRKGASIGTGATILCGVTIGKAALVGAGSVVTDDVPEGMIVAGNPAKIIGPVRDYNP